MSKKNDDIHCIPESDISVDNLAIMKIALQRNVLDDASQIKVGFLQKDVPSVTSTKTLSLERKDSTDKKALITSNENRFIANLKRVASLPTPPVEPNVVNNSFFPSLILENNNEILENVGSQRCKDDNILLSVNTPKRTTKARTRSKSSTNAMHKASYGLKFKKSADNIDDTLSLPVLYPESGINSDNGSSRSSVPSVPPNSKPSNEQVECSSVNSITKRPPSAKSKIFTTFLKGGSKNSSSVFTNEKEVVVGTPVKEGHSNYLLMFDMLSGIRISVSRSSSRVQTHLTDDDFIQSHKVAFDGTGQEVTPKTNYDFKFKDYAPWIFKTIRDVFHVESGDYLNSLTGKYVLSELGSPGKSGSFFYFSADYRFIIKTIHHSEHKFMRKILRNYYEHVKSNPNTLLSRIFGLHRVKLPGNKKIHFVVMGNVFPAHKDIHETYDLKGSTVGRIYDEEEALKNPAAVLKDLNWINRKQNIQFGAIKRSVLVAQIEKDVKYLQENRIMDYSLLVGIHDMVKGNKELIREKSLQVVDEPEIQEELHISHKKNPLKKNGKQMKRIRTVSEPSLLSPNNSKLSNNLPPERKFCQFYQDFGGYQATDASDGIRPIIYYIGIIDIFTEYNAIKKFEHFCRSLQYDETNISSVNPKFYGERFLAFMKNSISDKNPAFIF